MGSRMGLIGCLIVVVALLNGATAQVTSAGVYEVGDSLGWTVPPNTSYYTNWASTKTFFVGDRLIFNATGGTQYFESVSKAVYDNCTTDGLPSGIGVNPGSTVGYNLLSTGPDYIISTESNHCELGQKFSFNVSVVGSPTDSPNSSASSLTVGALFAVLTTTLISFMTYI
ncbi:cucumber peeling cupredoxin-like [Fagus crenata]